MVVDREESGSATTCWSAVLTSWFRFVWGQKIKSARAMLGCKQTDHVRLNQKVRYRQTTAPKSTLVKACDGALVKWDFGEVKAPKRSIMRKVKNDPSTRIAGEVG